MEYRYRPNGVCSREMIIELDGNIDQMVFVQEK